MTDRQDIEIDYCPKCRGVWLDRGELDKVIERSSANAPAAPIRSVHSDDRQFENYEQSERRHYDDDHDDNDRHHPDQRYKKHKKEGFLSDLFDF